MTIRVDHQDQAIESAGRSRMPSSFLSPNQQQAVAFLERCVRDVEPLAALTGGAGNGKTTALNTALARFESAGDRVVRVNNFVAGPLSLHRVLAVSLGVADAGELSAEALEPVLRRALADAGHGEPPVLAVDDAQSLLPETLRYLCLLAGLRENGRPLLRILLVGRPGFTVRQAMPLQFTLEAMRVEDAVEVVNHTLDATGVTLAESSVQDIAQHAQGNWRKLDTLLQAAIDNAERAPRAAGLRLAGQKPLAVGSVSPAPSRDTRSARRRSTSPGAWMALPALLLVFAGGAVGAYRSGMLGNRHAPVPVHMNASARPAAPPVPLGAAPDVVQPSAPAPASTAVQPVAPPATAAASTVVTPPLAPAAPKASPPTDVEASPAPAPTPASPPPAAAETLPIAAAPPGIAPPPARFRVYNISSCHRGVCPRWSVLDLDRKSHLVAAFDPASLHLDPETLQKLREGSIDLIVGGALTRDGADGSRLHADRLDSIAPHHPRMHQADAEPSDPAAPLTQSPPPSFLAFPAGSPATDEARGAGTGPTQLAPPPLSPVQTTAAGQIHLPPPVPPLR